MKSFTRPTKRTAIIGGATGIAIIGAIGAGAAGAASAADAPAPQPSASAPSGVPATGGPVARARTPHIGGDVLTVDGSTVTVKDPEGFTRTIVLAGDAKVTKDGASSTAATIVKGVHVEATGTVASNGTALDASAVAIGRVPAGGSAGGPGARGPKGPDVGKQHAGRRDSNGATRAPAPSGAPSAPASGS